ncbi:unnamed protein product, partial [Allacma fusca]
MAIAGYRLIWKSGRNNHYYCMKRNFLFCFDYTSSLFCQQYRELLFHILVLSKSNRSSKLLMERNIRPCKSKSGKWKRNARLKNLIAPYSHTTRRSVQRFRNRPTEPFGKCRSNHNFFEPSQLQTSDNLDISVIGPDETRRVGDKTGFTDITNFADHPGKSIPQNLSPQE